jgi:nitrilase
MFNTQLYIGPDGRLIRKHQKIMPTVGERLVHMGGFGDTFGAFPSEFGPLSGLICGENSNPLAMFALISEGTRLHVMSWPSYLSLGGEPMRNRVAIESQGFASITKAFVISACGALDEATIGALELPAEDEKLVRDPACSGGSLIVAPSGKVIAGPMGAEEGILYAECDIAMSVRLKLKHDLAGHYNRPDIFQLRVNRAAPRIYSVHQGSTGD